MATRDPSTQARRLPAGIYERTDKTGKTTFQVKVRLKGHPAQTETFERLTDAKRWQIQTTAAIRERRHFKTAEAQRHTLGELVDRYTRDVLPTKGTQRKTQGPQLAWWKGQLGPYLLCDVTPAMLAEARDKLAKTTTYRGGPMGPATVVRYMAALSHAFTIAVKEWGWMDDNPFRKVTRPKEPRGRVRFLSDEERERLLAACQESPCPYLYPIVVLALSSGMRLQEIMTLTWPQVDLGKQRIILERTKNGERRVVPLAGLALDLLREHSKVRRLDTALLWPSIHKTGVPIELRPHWVAAVQAAGLEDFTFHSLRHSAASYMLMNGATIGELAEVLGHRTLQMVRRYSHLSEAHTRGIVERMNAAIFGGRS